MLGFMARRSFSRLLPAIFFIAFPTPFLHAFSTQPAVKAQKATRSLLLDVERIGDRLVVVGERGHILVSDDWGSTWQQSEVPVNQMLNAVTFVDQKTGFAAGYDGHILKTTDGGLSWTLIRNGLNAQADINAEKLQQARQTVDDLRLQLEDSELAADRELALKDALEEAEWELDSAKERVESDVVASPLFDIYFADDKNGWAVGAFGTMLQTTDGGETFVSKGETIHNEMEYHLNAVAGLENGTVVIAGEAGFVSVSSDSGNTWALADLGYEGTIFALKASPLGDQMIATGLRGKTFKASEDALTWLDITPEVGFSLSGVEYMDEGQFLLVGHGGTLAVSHDDGLTYSYKTLPSRVSISTAIHKGKDDFILVGQGGIHATSVSSQSNK